MVGSVDRKSLFDDTECVMAFNKKEAFTLTDYEKAEHPDEHPLYGQILVEKKNSVGIKVALLADAQHGKPVLQIVVETPDGAVVDYCAIPKDWMNCFIRLGQNTYHLCISRTTKESIQSQMAYNEERHKRKELPYPRNLISDLIGEYCDIPLSEEQLRCLNIVLEEQIPSLNHKRNDRDLDGPMSFVRKPYDSYEDFVDEFRRKMGQYLPEDFDWDAHIGRFNYSAYC